MVIKCERLFGILVVNNQRANSRIIFEGGHQVKPKVALKHPRLSHPVTPDDILVSRAAKQLAIIGTRERVALRYTGGLHILVGSRNKYVIGLAEVALITRQFIGVIIPVHLQVEVATVDAIESIVAIQAERQIPINVRFIGNGRADESQCRPGCIKSQVIQYVML